MIKIDAFRITGRRIDTNFARSWYTASGRKWHNHFPVAAVSAVGDRAEYKMPGDEPVRRDKFATNPRSE